MGNSLGQRNVQVYAVIVETIKEQITSGKWSVGDRLPTIAQLATEFQVGPGSIREAARVLASEGILRIEHGRGIFVEAQPSLPSDPFRPFQDFDASSVLALFEARRILEPELAAFAAERGSDEEINRIVESAASMAGLVAAHKDFFVPDLEFHRQIAKAARNPVLAKMMEGVTELLKEGQRLTSRHQATVVRAIQYHFLIADAIRTHNAIQARLLMLSHVNDAISSLATLHGIEMPRIDASASAPATTSLLLPQQSLAPISSNWPPSPTPVVST